MHRSTRAFGVFITALLLSASAMAQRVPTATELMDWAEGQFTGLFPRTSSSGDRTLGPFTYRYYAATNNYLGVGNGDIYLMGNIVASQAPVRFAPVAQFACTVFPSSCAPAASSARGRTLYETYQGTQGYTCNLCHGTTPGSGGVGGSAILRAAGTAASSGDGSVIRNAINNNLGTPPMGQFSALTDAQLADIAAYINATAFNKPVQ